MAAFVARRLLQGIVVLIFVSFISFAIFQYLGDPVLTMAGRYATRAEQQMVREMLGLDQPFYLQFFRFIQNAVRGDFGISYVARVPVLELLLERLPASIELALAAQILAVVVGVSLGVLVAAYPRSFWSRLTLTGSLLGISLPTFVVGILLIYLFAVMFPWLPPYGRGELTTLWGSWETGLLTVSGLKHLVLPAVTLAGLQLSLLFRLTRGGMLETLQTDYIRTARAKGLGPAKILFKHALRNVLIPIVTMVGLQFGQLIGFSIVTETIFQWPGAGNLLLSSIYESDFPVMATYIMMVAFIVVILNTIVDILYALLNPRIRYS